MKNTIRQMIVTAALLLLYVQGYSQWQYAGNASVSAAGANFTSTAVDKNGVVYIAYQDQSIGTQQVTVKKFVSGSWVTVGTEMFSYGEADNISLAIDSASGTPYVAYSDAATNYGPTVMKFNGTAWDSVGPNGFSGTQSGYISLAVANGIPYVAYQDYNSASASISVSMFNGSTWTSLDALGFSGFNASLISLVIDHQGHKYVGYRDAGSANSGITVCGFDGSHWNVLGTTGFSVGAVGSVSLAVDKNDNLYAAYSDNGLTPALGASVMKYNKATSTWLPVGMPGFTSTEADYISLKINAAGTPVIAFSDMANSGKASVMQFNSTAWVQVGAADFTSGGAEYISMVIDPSGNPFVGYLDIANNRSASVKKYSFASGIGEVSEDMSLTVYPNPCSGLLNVKTSENGAYKIAIVNVVGEKLKEFRMNGIHGTFDISDLASGIYEVQISDDKQVLRVMKLVKE